MCMDGYVDEILIRERIADVRRRAALHTLVHDDAPRPARRGLWARVAQALRRIPRPVTRARGPLSRVSQHP